MIGGEWLPSWIYFNISIYIGSESDSLPEDITYIYFSLINGVRVESSSYLLPFSVSLQDSDSKSPYSKCADMIIPPVCYFEDVVYRMYDTAGLIVIASDYSCDVYINILDKLS